MHISLPCRHFLLALFTISCLGAVETVAPEMILEPESSTWLEFGKTMALDGDCAAIAMPGMAVDGDAYRGGVALYRHQAGAWQREALLTSARNSFAVSLDLADDTCVVGAAEGDGTVVVFDRVDGSWVQSQEIMLAGSEPYRAFGAAVAIAGDHLLIGAPEHDDRDNAGAAYLYHRVDGSWQFLRRYEARDDSHMFGRFGGSVAITASHLAIAAPSGIYHKELYVAQRDGATWGSLTAIAPPSTAVVPRIGALGEGLALSDDVLVIGAPWSNIAAGETTHLTAGACWIYRFVGGSWQLQAEVVDPEPTASQQLGRAVAIDDETGRVFCGGSGMVTGDFYYYGVAPGIVLGLDADGNGSWQVVTQRVGDPSLIQDCYGDALAADNGRLLVADVFLGNNLRQGTVELVDIASGSRIARWNGDTRAKLGGNYAGMAAAWKGADLIVGVPGNSGHNNATEGWGNVVMYRQDGSGWQEAQRLSSERSAIGDNFGSSLAVADDRLLVGAPARGDPSSLPATPEAFLYVCENGQWVSQAVLQHPDGGGTHDFGTTVGLAGDQALVGAPGTSDGGMVVVFEEQAGSWSQVQTLRASTPADDDGFGDLIAVDGSLLVVAARQYFASSSVTTFLRSDGTWQRQAGTLPMDGRGGIALDGQRLVIGSPYYDAGGDTNIGKVDIYTWDGAGWSDPVTLHGPGGKAFDLFGESVLLRGEWLLVGGENDDRVTIFHQQENGSWLAWKRFEAADGDGGNMGQSIALSSSGYVAAGMPFRGLDGSDQVGAIALRHFSDLALPGSLRQISVDVVPVAEGTAIETRLDDGTPQAVPAAFETTSDTDHALTFVAVDTGNNG